MFKLSWRSSGITDNSILIRPHFVSVMVWESTLATYEFSVTMVWESTLATYEFSVTMIWLLTMLLSATYKKKWLCNESAKSLAGSVCIWYFGQHPYICPFLIASGRKDPCILWARRSCQKLLEKGRHAL